MRKHIDVMLGRAGRFNLRKHFTLAMLAGVLAVLFILSTVYTHIASRQLLEQETETSVMLTQVFAATLWPEYASFVQASRVMPVEELINRRETGYLYRDITNRIIGTRVVKVKIYNQDGVTVFSTEPGQIGKNIDDNPGFISAIRGEIRSNITFRGQFHTFEKQTWDRNVVSSYVPVRSPGSDDIGGVFEVYTDVTEMVSDIRTARWYFVLTTVMALGALYFYLLVLVNRADDMLENQDRERRAQSEKIRRMAFYDELTGLGSRTHFHRKFDEVMKRARRSGDLFSVLMIDLDEFKPVNDSFGHDTGDRLLSLTGRRIRESIRETDHAFRIGGDEFVVLLEGMHDYRDAQNVARKLTLRLNQPVNFGEFDIRPSASMGYALFPADGETEEALMKNADIALYTAKSEGRNRMQRYRMEGKSKSKSKRKRKKRAA